jgi:hypothetical protein
MPKKPFDRVDSAELTIDRRTALTGQGGVNHVSESWLSIWSTSLPCGNYQDVGLLGPAIWDDSRTLFWYR